METSEDTARDEEAGVLRWRRQMFLDLGFNVRQSQRLAEQGADWHHAGRLLSGGCPVDTAFDLLSD